VIDVPSTSEVSYTKHSSGQERQPYALVDNFYPDTDALIADAMLSPGFIDQASDFYPGVRKLAPQYYLSYIERNIFDIVYDTFSIDRRRELSITLGAYSIATTSTEKLRPIQCVPHIDTHETTQFALVHYLCNEIYGGTSFYRHKYTGYESIDESRLKPYFTHLKQEVMMSEEHHNAYVCGDTALFERVCQTKNIFNRAILYPSNLLHSGDINPALGLSSDPVVGRLTLNAFITVADTV